MTKDDKTAKDEPAADAKPNQELNISKGKIKKNKKKKKHANKSETSVSSDSASDMNSAPPLVIDEPTREQFYDAHESYHGLPAPVENQLLSPPTSLTVNPLSPTANPLAPTVNPLAPTVIPLSPTAPATGTALLVARSEHGQDPKISVPSSATQGRNVARAKKEPSTITKPVTGPE